MLKFIPPNKNLGYGLAFGLSIIRMATMYGLTVQVGWFGLRVGGRLVNLLNLHLPNEPRERWQWLCHDDNTTKLGDYATWFTAGGAIRIAHYDVVDDVITRKL